MQLPIVFNDRYQLNDRLGEGGLAEVYLSQDLALGRLVAVKLLRQRYTTDPTFLVRFHREAQNAASLNNSNVVSVYDFGQDHNRPYIVMEYVPGSDLRTVINKGLLSIPQIIDYGIQICNGVALAHRRGMVHGDMKPGNILISPENVAKVTDFGLARALGESAMDDGELVWGTPAYFAPEQAAGDRVLPATDVYAIGIILYEMITGQVPFMDDDDQEIARKQLYEYPEPIGNLTKRAPSQLVNIVHKALMKDPAQRFHTADQLKQTLLTLKEELDQPNRRANNRARSTDWLAVFLGLIALVAVLGLVPLWTQVYRLYLDQPPPAAVPTLPALGSGQTRVPSLYGLSEPAATALLESAGLQLAVQDYEPHDSIEAFAVIRQSIPANAPAERGSTIYVTLSQGQAYIEVPGLIGLDIQAAAEYLASLGLQTKTRTVWSPEPPGTIVSQTPAAGALLTHQSAVTLQISNGTEPQQQ